MITNFTHDQVIAASARTTLLPLRDIPILKRFALQDIYPQIKRFVMTKAPFEYSMARLYKRARSVPVRSVFLFYR